MPAWDAQQYLQFEAERTQPCRDLVARIALDSPGAVVDLGCGPGNSTEVLAERWPQAQLTGLDSSGDMIATARGKHPDWNWIAGDITRWANETPETYDLVFSNAALQWLPEHGTLYPRLLERLNPGGALAVQVPNNFNSLPQITARTLAASPPWRENFPEKGVRVWHVHPPEFYYDLLAPRAARLDLWETEYLHSLPSAEAIVDWYKGSGLRPFLEALSSAEKQQRFCADYLATIRPAFPTRADGRVLFPFRRLFLVAYRGG